MDGNLSSLAETEDYVYITSIISLTFTALGLIGNILCARMMLTSPMMPFSSAIFICFVVLSDTAVLIYEVADDLAFHIDGWSEDDILYGGNQWRCRFGIFFYEVARVISAWGVVAMAAELTLVTGKPSRMSTVYSRNRSFYISLAICLVAVAGCFPFLVIVSSTEGIDGCTSKYEVFREIYSHVVLHMFVNCFLPLVLIAVCTVRSLYYIRAQAEEKRTVSYETKTKEIRFQLSRGILSICALFLLSVLPVTSIDLGYFVKRLVPDIVLQQPYWEYAHIVSHAIFMVNYASKFYLILLLEPQLRKGLSYISACGILRSKRSHSYRANTHNSIGSVRDGENRL